MEQLKKRAKELEDKISQAVEQLKIKEFRIHFDELQAQMEIPDFWQDQKHAAGVSKEASQLLERIVPWESLQKQLTYISELINLDDGSMETDLTTQLSMLNDRYETLRKELRFQGPYDASDVILSIYAGAGGTDAQDWAQMLLRMYIRWAEDHKLNVKTIDQSAGEEAGIKSATVEVTGGNFLYGRLTGENGVHRLVRLSPFNADNLRQTSFAKVEILPVIDKPGLVEIDEKDLKIDVYRAGGRGGQSVNTTDSAVRITHISTGISVAIQNERSQLQNRETAMTILRSRLAALQLEEHAENLKDIKGPSQANEWGSQIRNYVLHPYKQVKDTRSGYESSDVEKVLNGDLDPLISSWLEK